MDKGYTFIELIGILVLISLITMLVTPVMIQYMDNRKEELYDIQIDHIELALKTWASENKEHLPEKDGEMITLTLLQLKQAEILSGDITNPVTDKLIPDDMTMTITKKKKNYVYKVNKDSGTVSVFNESYYQNPSILLKGDSTIYVELGNPYIEYGVYASDAKGVTIEDVRTTITGSGNVIKTDEVGNYTITYTVNDNGLYSAVARTVIVRDTLAPQLIIPGNTSIDVNVTEFDLMSGVSATDNNKQEVVITVKSNLSFGIPGTYTITYTATDTSENSVSTKRIITINE